MRAAGIILVIIGILMLVFTGFNLRTDKKVIDAGNLEINQKQTTRVNWPLWAGGVAVVAGIILAVADQSKRKD